MTIESIYTRTISNGPSATIEAIVKFGDLFAVAYDVDGFEGLCITKDPDDPNAVIEEYEEYDEAKESQYYRAMRVARQALHSIGGKI